MCSVCFTQPEVLRKTGDPRTTIRDCQVPMGLLQARLPCFVSARGASTVECRLLIFLITLLIEPPSHHLVVFRMKIKDCGSNNKLVDQRFQYLKFLGREIMGASNPITSSCGIRNDAERRDIMGASNPITSSCGIQNDAEEKLWEHRTPITHHAVSRKKLKNYGGNNKLVDQRVQYLKLFGRKIIDLSNTITSSCGIRNDAEGRDIMGASNPITSSCGIQNDAEGMNLAKANLVDPLV
ncbi:uncharacterized protein [Prorops nasuta]|uniref:uncharacterized protein n=1 Tax=Prorops nasuta TaxID=863751 RepID=UPI0034CDC853